MMIFSIFPKILFAKLLKVTTIHSILLFLLYGRNMDPELSIELLQGQFMFPLLVIWQDSKYTLNFSILYTTEFYKIIFDLPT